MDLKALTDLMLPTLGEAGVKALKDEVDDLTSEANEPWKKAVLGLVASGVETYGPQGVQIATDALDQILAGEEPDLEWVDLVALSDLLAHLQNAEADRALASKAFLAKVGNVSGQIFGGFLKGLLLAAL